MDKYCELCYARDAKPCMECSVCNPGHRNFRPAPTSPPTTADRLRELAEADKDGRLLVLPCKVGDTVYWASLWGNGISQGEIKEIKISKFGIDLTMLTPNEITVRREFERTFSTYESAEAALKAGDPR